MKKLMTLVLAVAMLLTMCISLTAVAEGGDYKIAVSLNDADEYRTQWLNTFTELCDAKGYKVISSNAGSDASKQISDVESLLLQKPDVVVVHAYSADGAGPALDAIEAAGIPCVLFDFDVTAENYTTQVVDEQATYGMMQAQYIQQWLDADSSRELHLGYVVGMYAMEGAMPRRDGLYAGLGIEGAEAEAEANWSANEAMSITEDWLQAYPQMNVFASMSDEMAVGIIQALVSAGKNMDDVLVLGVDGSDVGKQYLESGELDATAARDVNIETAFTLETCEKILAGETVEKRVQPMGIALMTKEDFAK
ncbi:MAG: sugar ABC transporter substrate-binding protein [Clostridiales bacterium]|nr:sugar ABC transporter substrate-binding protein [Clostridiales bacterium]